MSEWVIMNVTEVWGCCVSLLNVEGNWHHGAFQTLKVEMWKTRWTRVTEHKWLWIWVWPTGSKPGLSRHSETFSFSDLHHFSFSFLHQLYFSFSHLHRHSLSFSRLHHFSFSHLITSLSLTSINFLSQQKELWAAVSRHAATVELLTFLTNYTFNIFCDDFTLSLIHYNQ